MVKKAVATSRRKAPTRPMPRSTIHPAFVDGDLYIVVYGLDGMVLAHGADKERIGTNQIDDKDPDGKRS